MDRFPFWRSAAAGQALMAVLALYVVVHPIVGYTALPLGALVTPQMRATYLRIRWESTAISSARSSRC